MEVVVSVDLSTLAPDFKRLLPIYDIIGEKLVLTTLFKFDPQFVKEIARAGEPVIVA